MKYPARVALACAVGLASWTTAAAQAPPPPGFDGRGWTVGHQQANDKQSLTEYVLPGQTVDNWRELVTSTVFFQPVPVARLVDEIHRLMSRDCPSLVWNVIRQDETTAVFEWRDSGCGGFESQTEIDRITIEKDGLYRLAYAVKTKAPLPADKRKQWLGILDQTPLAEGRVSPPAEKPAGRRPAAPMTPTAAQKLSTEQLAAGIRNVWPCVEPVKSEVKGATPGPGGLLVVYLVECGNGVRYTALVDPSGAVTSFPTPPQ
jgi:hypothetical protein